MALHERTPQVLAAWSQYAHNSSCPPAVADCHTSLVTPWTSSADVLVPAGFLQETGTTNRQRHIETGREDMQRHTLADTRAAEQQATPSNVFNYKQPDGTMYRSSAATNLITLLVGIYTNDYSNGVLANQLIGTHAANPPKAAELVLAVGPLVPHLPLCQTNAHGTPKRKYRNSHNKDKQGDYNNKFCSAMHHRPCGTEQRSTNPPLVPIPKGSPHSNILGTVYNSTTAAPNTNRKR